MAVGVEKWQRASGGSLRGGAGNPPQVILTLRTAPWGARKENGLKLDLEETFLIDGTDNCFWGTTNFPDKLPQHFWGRR